ncbi:MAG: hypothetical protein LUC86_03275 [Prevotellaceae bacterium]|nr:hypothetical protein [Prevotellaceae bacterium]
MNILMRYINRLRLRRKTRRDESANVVDGIVRARSLYKRLANSVHPDHYENPDEKKLAEELMRRVNDNRFNYSELVKLEKEIKGKL